MGKSNCGWRRTKQTNEKRNFEGCVAAGKVRNYFTGRKQEKHGKPKVTVNGMAYDPRQNSWFEFKTLKFGGDRSTSSPRPLVNHALLKKGVGRQHTTYSSKMLLNYSYI